MSKITAHFKNKKRKRQDNVTETVTLDSTDDESSPVVAAKEDPKEVFKKAETIAKFQQVNMQKYMRAALAHCIQ